MTHEDAPSRVLRRSFDVYYRDAERMTRMDALNARLVRTGSLVFDLGAHVGDRTGSFLRLGASVVALEPQPRVFRALRLIHGRHPRVILRPEAVGSASGHLDMHVNTRNPTVSTLSGPLVAAAPKAALWRDQRWDDQIRVPVTTLDALIATHGRPDFVKIDVEGYEHEVLLGLSQALPALSFEFTTLQREVALACLDRLTALGRYQFNISLGEDHALQCPNPVEASTIRDTLAALPDAANSGDIYAWSISKDATETVTET